MAAGLVFHWRGAKKHHFGKLFALVISVGMGVFAVNALKIDILHPPLVSQRKGVVVMLNENDPNCRDIMIQIEEQSPFPVRWDPAYDPEVMRGIEQDLSHLHGLKNEYSPQLAPLSVQSAPRELASVRRSSDGLLGDVMQHWDESHTPPDIAPPTDLFVRARISVDSNLKGRLPQDEFSLPPNLVADDSFGQSFLFLITMDAKGIIRGCMPLPGGSTDASKTTERQKNLATWLRLQRFKPAAHPKGDVTGELELQIEASRE